jgi:putative FmdB family regulatory protein
VPIFEYKCKSCGEKFEFYLRGSEAPTCPHCGSENLTKLLSTFAAHVKGASSGAGTSSGSSCAGCSGGHCSTCK